MPNHCVDGGWTKWPVRDAQPPWTVSPSLFPTITTSGSCLTMAKCPSKCKGQFLHWFGWLAPEFHIDLLVWSFYLEVDSVNDNGVVVLGACWANIKNSVLSLLICQVVQVLPFNQGLQALSFSRLKHPHNNSLSIWIVLLRDNMIYGRFNLILPSWGGFHRYLAWHYFDTWWNGGLCFKGLP